MTELSMARRSTAAAGTPPVESLRRHPLAPKRLKSGAPPCVLLTCAASAREYETGGCPTQWALAGHADFGARPPPLPAGKA